MLDRWHHINNLIKINNALNKGAKLHYEKSGLTYVDVPEIVGITGACENVDTLFKIGNRLGLPLFMTQTGQLSLEQALQTFPGVYTVIHSGRDEEIEDERHLRQFRLTEEEFDCTLEKMTRINYDEEKMYEALLTHIELAIKSMINQVTADTGELLEENYGRKSRDLKEISVRPFGRISYEKAIGLLQKNGYPKLLFGDDLKAEHEQKIVELANGKIDVSLCSPVFIMRYPKEIKFFNMKVSQTDKRVVLSADLIFPYAGEGTGAAVREHEGEKLKERLLTSTMFKLHQERGGKYEDFLWYVDDLVMAKRTNPHAGYGIGNDRVVQFLLGQKDIRKSSLFSQMAGFTGDWDMEKRGQLYTLAPSTNKKTILLTIGSLKEKEKLLPCIKNLADTSFLLCATQHTHDFLKERGVGSTLVYKINEKRKKPNLANLLKENFFDIIINLSIKKNADAEQLADGKIIRKAAIESGTTLVTDIEVAEVLLENLAKNLGGKNFKSTGQIMEDLGLVYPVSGGIQIDVTVAKEQKQGDFLDASFCDHNCTGNYECPAALSKHPGLQAKTMAEANLLMKGIKRTMRGIKMANTVFRQKGLLEKYFKNFSVPPPAREIIKKMFTKPPCEINLFGGNAECHPQILKIIAGCKESGFTVNLTTTGGKLLYDENFLKGFLANPPHVLALSADEFGNLEQAGELASLTMKEIKQRWLKTSPLSGQKKKALEAVYAARLAETQINFPKILFNLVVHPGNIDFIEALINLLRANFSTALINPYFGQSSFLHGAPVWNKKHLALLADFINRRIQEHLENKPGLLRRLQYWLMLKATMETFKNDPQELIRKLSGYGIWKCYETSGAGRYVKVGASSQKYRENKIAGGHLACFWNSETITGSGQVWEMSSAEISDYLLRGMNRLAGEKNVVCPGCIMPRLNFDMVSVELGMSKTIVPAYLKLRRQYAGF